MLPIIFPIPISVCPLRIAIIEVINSGKEVPIAITVNPIIFSDKPNSVAITTALSTVSIAPIYNTTIPIPISPKDFR